MHPRVGFLSISYSQAEFSKLLNLSSSRTLGNLPSPALDLLNAPVLSAKDKAITSTYNYNTTVFNSNRNAIVTTICKTTVFTSNEDVAATFKSCIFQDLRANTDRMDRILSLLRLDHLNELEKENVINLVRRNSDRFYIPGDYLDRTVVLMHKIVTTDDKPIHTKQYRFPPIHREEITKQVNELLQKDIVMPSTSPYNSPIWIVPKKPDSQGNKRWRMVMDYRKLNEKTVGDAYPLPNICDILDQLGAAKYFSVLDLASGFHQIPMDPGDAHKTAFSTPHGHYEFLRMPFGLKNAPATFQRLMDQILTGLQGIEMFVYMDDIVIYASSLREHDIKMEKLMQRLRSANLTLQPDKCEFLRHEVAYLGHVLTEDGVRPDPQKIAAVKSFPTPRNLKNIRQFLGLAGYYRRFISDFSRIASPLSNLLKKDREFRWNADAQKAFDTLRDLLCKEPILQFPDFEKDFLLTTDASNCAVAGVLSQGPIGKDLPISYASRVLNAAEKNYSTIEKELLAITYCVSHFRPYLYGRRFTLVTDHQPLVWLHKVKDPTSRLARWRLKLEEYDYTVVYKAGKTNKNADALSRNPLVDITYFTILHISKRRRLNPVNPQIAELLESDDESDEELPRKIRPVEDLHQRSATKSETSDESIFSFPQGGQPLTAPLISSNHEPPIKPSTSHQGTSVSPGPPDEIESELIDWWNLPRPPEDDAESIASSVQSEDSAATADNSKCIIEEVNALLLDSDDNWIILVTADGHPVDKGALELLHAGKLPQLNSLMLGRARVYPSVHIGKHIIALPVTERRKVQTDEDILNECFTSLFDVVTELGLQTVCMHRTEKLGKLPWRQVRHLLVKALAEQKVNITFCLGPVITPPVEDRVAIIREHHESAVGGHKGITKTYQRIKQRFMWHNMKQEIQSFIRECRICQTMKLVRKKTRQPMILTDTPGRAFDKVALDITGPYRTTPRGNSYILTMQDLLTKYSVYAPLQDATAENIADAFIHHFICRFGCPRSILTDQGTNFLSHLMKRMTKKFRIKQFRTTAYHPQSNGSLERSHHVLVEYLKCFVSKEECWDDLIERANFSYNTAVHEGTGHSPHELIFGRVARIPSNFNQEGDLETYYSYRINLFRKIHELQESARANLIKAKERSKVHYDRRVHAVTFKEGDNVFLLNNKKHDKFSKEYLGPYRVIRTLDRENVEIQIGKSSRIVHTNRLRKAYYSEPG
jgi:transposase InsO family protein